MKKEKKKTELEKELYEDALSEVIHFGASDIIATSIPGGGGEGSWDGNGGEGEGGGNEGEWDWET